VSNGGAIYNTGILTLESCIFSGNQTTVSYASGGALYSANTLTVRGCTFYGNTAGYQGGAVYFSASGKTLTLTGNLFYGNTAPVYPVVRNNSGTISASYNVADAAFGTGNTQTGWAAGTGDTTFTALGITGSPFVNTTSFVPVPALQSPGVLPSPAPAGFPATDFYGAARTFPGAPGAVSAP
jgi:predicted outer membrane repeat protein